jgi:hypothetical protein
MHKSMQRRLSGWHHVCVGSACIAYGTAPSAETGALLHLRALPAATLAAQGCDCLGQSCCACLCQRPAHGLAPSCALWTRITLISTTALHAEQLNSRMSRVSRCISQWPGVGIALLHQRDKGEEVHSLSQRPGRCLRRVTRHPHPALSIGEDSQMSRLHERDPTETVLRRCHLVF